MHNTDIMKTQTQFKPYQPVSAKSIVTFTAGHEAVVAGR
jgi:hypothetical protein